MQAFGFAKIVMVPADWYEDSDRSQRMIRKYLAVPAAVALAIIVRPGFAQGGSAPAAAPPSTWVDPQASNPGADVTLHGAGGQGADGAIQVTAGVPHTYAVPFEAYPTVLVPLSGTTANGTAASGGPDSTYVYGYALPGPYGAAPYSYAGHAYAPVMWVQVPIETRYTYSAPTRHEHEVTEERVEELPVQETTRHEPRTKYTKGKVIRTTR